MLNFNGEAMTTLAPLNKNDWDLECEELANSLFFWWFLPKFEHFLFELSAFSVEETVYGAVLASVD